MDSMQTGPWCRGLGGYELNGYACKSDERIPCPACKTLMWRCVDFKWWCFNKECDVLWRPQDALVIDESTFWSRIS